MYSVSRQCVMRVYSSDNVTPMVRMGAFLLSTVRTHPNKRLSSKYFKNVPQSRYITDQLYLFTPFYSFSSFLLFYLPSFFLIFSFPPHPHPLPQTFPSPKVLVVAWRGRWWCAEVAKQGSGMDTHAAVILMTLVLFNVCHLQRPLLHTHICQLLSFLSALLPLHFPATYTFINLTHPLDPFSLIFPMHACFNCMFVNLSSTFLTWSVNSTPSPFHTH